jgi:hypothetical protein
VSFDEAMQRTAEAIGDLPAASEVYVSFDESRSYHATLDFFVQQEQFARSPSGAEQYHLYWHNKNCLVIPPAAGSTLAYLLPPEGESFLPLLEATYADGETSVPTYDRDGLPIFAMFRIDDRDTSTRTTPAPQIDADYSLGTQIKLLGADIAQTEAKPGDVLDITLYWRADEAIDRSHTIFVQVIGETLNAEGSPVWGQRDEPPCQDTFPTTAWESGALVLTRHFVTISDTAPAGSYRLDTGMYFLPTAERLPVFDSSGHPVAGNSATLMQLEVLP